MTRWPRCAGHDKSKSEMKRITLIICFAFCFVKMNAQLSLDSCQVWARQQFPAIKQFDLIEKSREMNVSNAARGYLPQLSITGIGGYVDGLPSISIPIMGQEMSFEPSKTQLIGMAQLNQPIWDGGYTHAQKTIAKANSEVERENLEIQFQNLKERVNQLFFGILMIDEQIRLSDLLDTNLNLALKRAEIARQNGVAFQSDIDAIRVEILKAQQSKIKLNAQRKAYADMLALMIGKRIDANSKFEIPNDKFDILTADLKRPELELFKQQKALLSAQEDLIRVKLMPKIGLMGFAVGMSPGIDMFSSSFNHIFVGGLSVSWNISGLYTNGNDKNLIKTNISKVENQEEIFRFNTNLQMQQQQNDLLRSKQMLEQDAEIVQLRSNIKDASVTKYGNGACTMNDLLRDMNAENMAKQDAAIHRIEYLMNLYNYKTTIGSY